MPQVQLAIPTGSYASTDPRASCRRLVNCFAESGSLTGAGFNSVPDSKQKTPASVILRRAPGIPSFATDGTSNPLRGMWMMAGVEYAVMGQTLYSVSATGALTKLGTGISGSGLVRMSDNTQCLVILLPGTSIAYTYDLGSGTLRQLNAAGFTQYGAIDLAFIDSYIVFLALNGREFFNDDGQIASGSGPITFNNGNVFPREFGTDNFLGMCIQNRTICMFGERTSELYIDAGTASSVGSPFADSPDGFIECGMLLGTAYCAVKQDNSVFWIANDRTVRRLNGQTPLRVSNHGIESVLESINVAGSYGFPYSIGGHLMVVFTFPAAPRTIVYDCTTGDWHEMASYGLGYWRPLCCHNAFGKYLVGDSQGSGIGYLATGTLTEFGSVRTSTWTHQTSQDKNNRLSYRRLELVLGGGFAPSTGTSDVVNPQITLSVSDDGGMTFRAFPLRSLGTQGAYTNRIIWNNLGISRQRVHQFELSAAVESWMTDLVADVERCRW